MKELLFDPHGGHTRYGTDDGISSQRDMVYAAHEQNIITIPTGHDESAAWEQHLDAMREVGRTDHMLLAAELSYRYKENGTTSKGEMIAIFPANKTYRDKMAKRVVDPWRENDYGYGLSLAKLFDFIHCNLTDYEEKQIVYYMPHVVALDGTRFGRVLTLLAGEPLNYFSPEIYNAEVAEKIHMFEVLNAAHPGATNRKSVDIARMPEFAHIGWGAGSDSHHHGWVGAAATLLQVEEDSADGMRHAMQQKKTIPVSGIGELSHSWLPFMLWTPTSPQLRDYTPKPVYQVIPYAMNIQRTLEKYQGYSYEDRQQMAYEQGWLY